MTVMNNHAIVHNLRSERRSRPTVEGETICFVGQEYWVLPRYAVFTDASGFIGEVFQYRTCGVVTPRWLTQTHDGLIGGWHVRLRTRKEAAEALVAVAHRRQTVEGAE